MQVWRVALLLGIAANCLLAQKAETRYYQAVLSEQNTAPGVINLIVHSIRDGSGQITSASLDFAVVYRFPGPVTFTGIELRRTIFTILSVPLSIPTDYSGVSGFTHQVQVPRGATWLSDLQQNPGAFSIELKTADQPAGALAGVFASAVRSSAMSSLRGVASAVALVTATAVFNPSGNMISATLGFVLQFPSAATLTRVALTDGEGKTLLDSTPPSGSRFVWQILVAPDLTSPDAYNTVLGIFDRPLASLSLGTFQGALTGVLQPVDTQTFPVTLLPSFEVPPVFYSGVAPSVVTVSTFRDLDGLPAAAAFTFDVNYRLPSSDLFTGLYLQQGPTGINGPAVVSSGYTALKPFITDPSGNGNLTTTTLVTDPPGLAAIDMLLHTPDQVYLNIHTQTFPGGALRSQMGFTGARPNLVAVLNSVNDRNIRAVAPGAIISIYGSDLASGVIDLTGYHGSVLSPVYQGIAVTVGGRGAPFTYVSPGQINAQVPFESTYGMLPLIVSVNGQESAPLMINVQPVAPGIFFDAVGGVVVKNSNFSVLRPDNPAHAGEVLVIYCTGLGQTTPPLSTGWRVLYPPLFHTAPVTVTIGGQFAPVIYSIASPQYIGLYQVAVRAPAGLIPGNQPLVMTIQGVQSNTVNIATAP